MIAFIARRAVISIVMLFVIATMIFAFIRLVPGDPAQMLLNADGTNAPSGEAVATLRHKLGLDAPITVQYADYIGKLAQLDLGTSLRSGTPVAKTIAQRLPVTLELIVVSILLSVIVAIPLGTLAATMRSRGEGTIGRSVDVALSAFVSAGVSIPVFVVGEIFVLIFAVELHWLPAGGYVSVTSNPISHLSHLVLPAVAMSIWFIAVITRMTRSSVLEIMPRDWVRTARGKGLSRNQVLRRHVLRNGLAPIITIIGLHAGTLVGGTILVESIFNVPGMGAYLLDAALTRDYPQVQGVVLVVAASIVTINLLVEIGYGWLDPRVRHA